MKTLAKKIIKKTYFILKKELNEFYSDLILILRGFVPTTKKFFISNPVFFVGVMIGIIFHII